MHISAPVARKERELPSYLFTFWVLYNSDYTADGLKLSGIIRGLKEMFVTGTGQLKDKSLKSPSHKLLYSVFQLCLAYGYIGWILPLSNLDFVLVCIISLDMENLCPEKMLSPASEVNTLCTVLPKEGNVGVQNFLTLFPRTWSLER